MSDQPDEALGVLRGIWAAQGQTLDVGEDGDTKACKRMADVNFDGLATEDEDLRTAWRARLAREGKLDTAGGTVADLVRGEPR
jgi:hypothetical protein